MMYLYTIVLSYSSLYTLYGYAQDVPRRQSDENAAHQLSLNFHDEKGDEIVKIPVRVRPRGKSVSAPNQAPEEGFHYILPNQLKWFEDFLNVFFQITSILHFLKKIFHLKKRQVNIKTEFSAGCIMFLSSSYVIAVVPRYLWHILHLKY